MPAAISGSSEGLRCRTRGKTHSSKNRWLSSDPFIAPVLPSAIRCSRWEAVRPVQVMGRHRPSLAAHEAEILGLPAQPEEHLRRVAAIPELLPEGGSVQRIVSRDRIEAGRRAGT